MPSAPVSLYNWVNEMSPHHICAFLEPFLKDNAKNLPNFNMLKNNRFLFSSGSWISVMYCSCAYMRTSMHLCVFLSSFCKIAIFSFYCSSNHSCCVSIWTIGFEWGHKPFQVSTSLRPRCGKCVYVLMYACISLWQNEYKNHGIY